ncbi:AMP-binding protein [Microbacterium sp.]|uniref:class I adenylate-forming enzyme family protein n=2 Tax=Microbacterium TaxID=33882 RepID=UPI00257F983D|nr:AMP-binding protein [Microbacterium sp.]
MEPSKRRPEFMPDTSTTLSQLPWLGPAAGSDAFCLRDERRALTYAQVEIEAGAFAEQLTYAGVSAGDVVAVMMPNSVELLIAMLGAWRVGAIVTPINPTFTPREVSYQIEDSHASILVGRRIREVDVATIESDQMWRVSTSPLAEARIDPNRVALLVYTSGSTGQPKGVMLDHANLNAMATQIATHFRLTSDDHALLVLPLFHVNSLCVTFLAPMSVGAQVTILERFAPQSFISAAQAHRPTYFSAVPAIFAHLAALPTDVEFDTTSLRFAICGAAPVAPELLERCQSRFGMKIIEGYGLTEATCASACNPIDGPRKPGSVGTALPGQQIRIVDSDGQEVAPGERGEIVISGPTVMRGYLGRIEATATAIRDGWLHTGDVGVQDDDGYVRVVDRIKDMIIRGGENIYPKEIEAHLATHPGVLESAVVGRPDPVLGELPVAFVVVAPGFSALTTDELIEHCREGLAKIKVPVAVDIVAELPRNPVGKVDKPALRREFALIH